MRGKLARAIRKACNNPPADTRPKTSTLKKTKRIPIKIMEGGLISEKVVELPCFQIANRADCSRSLNRYLKREIMKERRNAG